jgi:hypothetical protein
MAEQADAAGAKAAGIGKGISDVVGWLLAILAGFAGYAAPQLGLDLPKAVHNLLATFKLDTLFGGPKSSIDFLISGAIYTGIGGTALYWGMKYDKMIGAIAKIFGAHLLGRGIRLIFSGIGG